MLSDLIARNEAAILDDWLRHQQSAGTYRPDLIDTQQLREQSTELLRGMRHALGAGGGDGIHGEAWAPVREWLGELSRSRARSGFSPVETATFVLSLKQPLFAQLRGATAGNAQALADEIWTTTVLLDELALITFENYTRGREQVIERQQQDLLELSTPVVRLWQGVLALPLIGTLDSARTQVVMENLLQEIVRTRSSLAIIDITGVPTVDTLVAQHLLKTVAAARLMGAECIISGIRPQIAQTVVHLGVDLGDVITKASLADAFALALTKLGKVVVNANQAR